MVTGGRPQLVNIIPAYTRRLTGRLTTVNQSHHRGADRGFHRAVDLIDQVGVEGHILGALEPDGIDVRHQEGEHQITHDDQGHGQLFSGYGGKLHFIIAGADEHVPDDTDYVHYNEPSEPGLQHFLGVHVAAHFD